MNTLRALFRSSVGQKAVMALTGVFLFGWLLLHLLGNLLVFAGPAALDGYGALLHSHLELLWPMRAALLGAAFLHVTAAWRLTARARRARAARYAMQRREVATVASRTMRWGGGLLLLFVVFHLLHLSTGTVHPEYVDGSVYHNVVSGLRPKAVALFYLCSVTALGLHLAHGLWSSRRSLGLLKPKSQPAALHRRFSATVALLLALGFGAIPLAVLCGWLR